MYLLVHPFVERYSRRAARDGHSVGQATGARRRVPATGSGSELELLFVDLGNDLCPLDASPLTGGGQRPSVGRASAPK